jgi:AcrR family transcriptional regulator
MYTLRKGRPRSDSLVSQRQEEILLQATKTFARFGFPGTDVQVIADELGVGKGTIYRYFSTKEELFLSSVDRVMRMLNAHITSVTAPVENPIKKIVAAVDNFLYFFESNPDFVELLIQERAVFRNREKPTYEIHREQNIKPWHELIESLISEGKIRKRPVEEITGVISKLLYGTLFLSHYSTEPSPHNVQRDSIIAIVLGGILTENELPNLSMYLAND